MIIVIVDRPAGIYADKTEKVIENIFHLSRVDNIQQITGKSESLVVKRGERISAFASCLFLKSLAQR